MKHQSTDVTNFGDNSCEHTFKKTNCKEVNLLKRDNPLIDGDFDLDEARLTLKLCSFFLQYPDNDWIENAEIDEAMTMIKNERVKQNLKQFTTYLQKTPFDKLTENYVQTFDFTEQASLYLTHKVFGDNRERGLAFVKLKMEFAKAGFYIKNDELPDYLPLILEFAAIAEAHFVRKVFLIHKKALDELFVELEKNNSEYAHLLDTCLAVVQLFLHEKASREHDAS